MTTNGILRALCALAATTVTAWPAALPEDRAILYTLYEMDLEVGGETVTESGRGTEIFVRRDGEWVNSGWHLDAGHSEE